MNLRRSAKNAALKGLGLRRLHDTRFVSGIRYLLDEIDAQHIRDSNPCQFHGEGYENRGLMYSYVYETEIKGGPIDYLEFGVFKTRTPFATGSTSTTTTTVGSTASTPSRACQNIGHMTGQRDTST